MFSDENNAEENAKILSSIHKNFDTATVIMECIAKREGVEKSIQQTTVCITNNLIKTNTEQ